jgi:glyoxylase-like metal-dependent hydrolase (beta-lactamase superfamily II)
MHALPAGRLRLKRRVYFPDASADETIEMPVASYLIRHRQGNVLFDTGCHPSIAVDAAARWGGLAKVMPPVGAQTNALASLADVGLGADDVDVVVCSHLHPDHCGCNVFFARATVICHAEELAAARSPEAEKAGYLAIEFEHGQRFDTISCERDLFDDTRVVLIPLPGHTPGTIGALVATEHSGLFLLASDTVSLRATLDRDLVPRNTWNGDVLRASLEEVRRIEASGATVICGHDDAQWAGLRKGRDAYM